MMLKALLKVRLAAFGAYFTGASRSRRRQSKVQKIGMLAVMLYALAAFGMLFYTSFSAIAGIYAHEGFVGLSNILDSELIRREPAEGSHWQVVGAAVMDGKLLGKVVE